MNDRDTIAAIATPAGRGGIGVIRVSGGLAGAVADQVLGRIPAPRRAVLAAFLSEDGEALDNGLALFFPAPGSYTGEDVLELHGHGGPVVMDLLLKRCLACGARPARPGEFTERAFLNGKMDLAQAEAVADLIDSASEQAARSAQRSLQGAFSAEVNRVLARLVALRTYVEAAIDFPEEEIDFLDGERLQADLEQILSMVDELLRGARQGNLLREGLRLVLAGLPNAGKSSLMNALAQYDRAIVSDQPGTTRDTIELQVQVDGMPVIVVDTAGLRDTPSEVENEGVRRARAALAEADHALLVIDDAAARVAGGAGPMFELPHTLVFNKIDLSGRPPGKFVYRERPALAVSAKNGQGLAALREHLKHIAGYRETEASGFIARRRHLHAVEQAAAHIAAGRAHIQARAGELLAEELRLAHRSLGEITGTFTSEDLLDRIFSSFCIGK